MLLVVDEGIVACVIGKARNLAAWQGQRGDGDRKQRCLDRVDVGQALQVAGPIGGVPARDVVFLGIHHVDVLTASELCLHHRMIVAGDELVGDRLVVEFLEGVDVLLGDLRMILPTNEGQRLCRRGEGASARERAGGEGHPALQHTSTRDEEIVERRGHVEVFLVRLPVMMSGLFHSA
jgi:hypothetical protein